MISVDHSQMLQAGCEELWMKTSGYPCSSVDNKSVAVALVGSPDTRPGRGTGPCRTDPMQ